MKFIWFFGINLSSKMKNYLPILVELVRQYGGLTRIFLILLLWIYNSVEM